MPDTPPCVIPQCAFCHSYERNITNSGMACWDKPDSPCTRASKILYEHFGDDYASRTPDDYVRAFAQAQRELEPKSRWDVLLAEDDLM